MMIRVEWGVVIVLALSLSGLIRWRIRWPAMMIRSLLALLIRTRKSRTTTVIWTSWLMLRGKAKVVVVVVVVMRSNIVGQRLCRVHHIAVIVQTYLRLRSHATRSWRRRNNSRHMRRHVRMYKESRWNQRVLRIRHFFAVALFCSYF